MLDASDVRRRWVGSLCLGVSLLMLILGLTVVNPLLSPALFVAYWALCFLFTVAAMLVALLDIRALRSKTHREHFELLEKTLQDVDEAGREKKRRFARPANGRPKRGGRPPRRRH